VTGKFDKIKPSALLEGVPILNWIKKLLGSEKCYLCGQKANKPRYYISDDGKKVAVCTKCVPYAERRAMQKYQ